MSFSGLRAIGPAMPTARSAAFQLDPNEATWSELAQLPGIGEVVARKIVSYRERPDTPKPAFRLPGDLDRVPGIGPKTAARIAPYLRFPGGQRRVAVPLTSLPATDTVAPRTGSTRMSIKDWSENIILAELQDDPVFSDDLNGIQELVEKRKGGTHVVLDFTQVNFLNSSNIAKLLKLRKVLHSTSPGKLRLCGINTGAWGVFLVTGLDKLFEFCDDAASGLASVQLG